MVDKNGDWTVSYICLGIDALIFTTFIVRLRTGYFDYVSKVQRYVKGKGESVDASVNASVAV